MKKRGRVTILWLFLFVLSVGISGCMKAGSNEIVTTGGNAGTDQSGEEETEIQRYEVVLTEEEANQDHLTTKLSDLVEVDAYITPYDLYKNGVGQWHMNSQEEAEDASTFSEIDPNETVLNTVTFSDFVEAIDQMAESLGSVYQEAWEATKVVDDFNYLNLFPDFDININTEGIFINRSGNRSHEFPVEMENLSFLPGKTALNAVQTALQALELNASDHVSIEVGECYEFDFYQTVDGIPITDSRALCEIKAGDMSVDSMRYNERYETSSYALYGNPGYPAASIIIGEKGFNFHIYAKRSFTLYREAQPVIDINDVLEMAGEILHEYKRTIKVTNIEFGMGDKVVGEEGEKKRIVLSPYWAIYYYMGTQTGSGEMKLRMLNIDAYTGEVVYDSEI